MAVREVHITPAAGIGPAAAVESACAEDGLTITLRGTLAAYPGCDHWHLKKGRQPGTLEITWWPQTGQLWLKVAANRDGPWVDAAANQLRMRLET